MEVNKYDYANNYEHITKSVASINTNGCIAVCINCDIFEASKSITKQIKLKIYSDWTTKVQSTVKITDIYTARYECSAILLNEKFLVLVFEDNLSYSTKKILHLYDLKQLDTAILKVETEYLNNIIRSFMNEEKIYFITEEMPFIYIFNLKLEPLGSIGSLNYPNQYYIESNKIFINNGYIFCQNAKTVGILNETTGVLLKKLELIEDEFEIIGINRNSEIFVFAPKNN
jgi:hypothetical protein